MNPDIPGAHAMAEKIGAASLQLSEVFEAHQHLFDGPPPPIDSGDAPLFAVVSAVEAAMGRLEDASALIAGSAVPADNPAPFDSFALPQSLDVYDAPRVTAALMSKLREDRTHPAAYYGHADDLLGNLPSLDEKIHAAMEEHSPSDPVLECLYGEAQVIATGVMDKLTPGETSALMQAAALAERQK